MSVATRARVLRALRAYRAEHGISPTIREVMALADVSSTSEVNRHLGQLESLGAIRHVGPAGAARCWVPISEAGDEVLREVVQGVIENLDAGIDAPTMDQLQHTMAVAAAILRAAIDYETEGIRT